MTSQFNPSKIKLIIGLGNPGREYKNTYHGVGFLFIDNINKRISSAAFGDLVMTPLLKSDSYMNNSGIFVKTNLKKYGLKPEQILIAHDDTDIEIGKYKLSFGRGSAGHKGIDSIIKSLKTKNFWRLRLGISPISPIGPIGPIGQRPKAGAFVLKKISTADKKLLGRVFRDVGKFFIASNAEKN